jgi:hypothetical protein
MLELCPASDVTPGPSGVQGFSWLDKSGGKGSHKWGFVGSNVGDLLTVHLNTVAPNSRPNDDVQARTV